MHAPAFAQMDGSTIADFAWLTGCWERSGDGWSSVEQWMGPAGGMMLGMSRTIVADTTREFEFLRIAKGPDGVLNYVALPSGQDETWFKLVRSGENEAVFENPEHDFPQRIIYRLFSDGELHARIEGNIRGELKGRDFKMNRRSCE